MYVRGILLNSIIVDRSKAAQQSPSVTRGAGVIIEEECRLTMLLLTIPLRYNSLLQKLKGESVSIWKKNAPCYC